MIKCVVIDLDGTLFHGHGESVFDLSTNSIKALELLKNQGVKICIASGRAILYSLKLFEKYDLKNPCLCGFNGAIIYDKSKVIDEKILSNDDILDIYHEIQKYNTDYLTCFIQSLDGDRILEKPFGPVYDRYLSNLSKDGVTSKLYSIPLIDFIKKESKHIGKMSIIANNSEDAVDFRNHYKDIFKDRFNINTSTKIYVEFTHPLADKSSFIEYLKKEYHFKNDEIACFGDSYNDFGMFKEVKYSFIMKHGEESLFEKCYAVVEDVYEAALMVKKINEN